MTMRAAVVMEHGDLSKISYFEDYPLPEISPVQVLVKVGATALNYHDIFTRRGMEGIKVPLPLITGSDIAGEIVQVGSQAGKWNVGERVLIDPLIREGGRYGIIGEIINGGKAEYVAAFHHQLIQLPYGISYENAAALPIAYGTAYRMMVTIGAVGSGETVLILGASGGVGVACVQLAKLLGATVIACAGSEEKLSKLKAIGADHAIDYTSQDLLSAVHAISGKPRISGAGGLDVVVNFTGGDSWMPSLRCLRVGGRALTCGATAGFDVGLDLRYVWSFEHQILGSNGWKREDLITLLNLVAGGRLKPVVGTVLPIERTAEAEQMMELRQIFGKVLVKP